MKYMLAIDQGTTSTRAMIFSATGEVLAKDQLALKQYYPDDGWVEHDPEEIWQATLSVCRNVLQDNQFPVEALGISNQRETTLLWDKKTGEVIHKAIVWQDRRTADFCEKITTNRLVDEIQDKTGLLIDPYFSGTKIAWLLDNVVGARKKAQKGELAFGTIDTFLLWRLTNGKMHATDATNASRTMLYNIKEGKWDVEILQLLNIPQSLLPEVKNSSDDFGVTAKEHFGTQIPIASLIGDQQAATVGQACFQPGMVKSTYGTGCFMLLNTGDIVVKSQHRLLSTIAYQIENKITYGLEGSIFVAGAAVQWLRDCLRLVEDPKEMELIVSQLEDNGGVYLVPAFTGLGAPYWDPHARGALLGLKRDTGMAHIIRAALEASVYQTKDLLLAMEQDSNQKVTRLRVDGGMANNHWLLQFLADMLNIPISKPGCVETSAFGAAVLAGLQVGIYSSLDDITEVWVAKERFKSKMLPAARDNLYKGWQNAIKSIISKEKV